MLKKVAHIYTLWTITHSRQRIVLSLLVVALSVLIIPVTRSAGWLGALSAPATSSSLPRFANYVSPEGLGDGAGEPSIGVNWKSEKTFSNSMFSTPNGGTAMYFGGFLS